MVEDHRDRGRAARALRGDPPLVHGDDVGHLGERLRRQRSVVMGRVHDDLVAALEHRVLVGHHADRPAGRVGRAAGRPKGIDLGRGQVFVAGAERARAVRTSPAASGAPSGAPSRGIVVVGPGAASGRDHRPGAAQRIAAQAAAAAAGRAVVRSPPTGRRAAGAAPAVRAGHCRSTKASPPDCLASYMAPSARASTTAPLSSSVLARVAPTERSWPATPRTA